MGEFVRLELDEGVGTIVLDRPKMNALNRQLVAELRETARAAAEDTNVRAVVVWGGPKVFAAGADIKEMATMSMADVVDHSLGLQTVCDLLAGLPKPVVAAINGYALGGGCEVALTADRRIAGQSAVLGQPEILLGVIPGAGGTQRLPRLVGPSVAKDLCFTGRFVPADEALRIGLVDEVVSDESVYETAVGWARQFSTGPGIALRFAKEAIDRGLSTDIATGMALERQLFASLFATEDQRIGMQSFIEHGPGKAEFTGH